MGRDGLLVGEVVACSEVSRKAHRASEAGEREEVRRMEKFKMSLCPACTACPEVEIIGDSVRIGDADDLAVLKKDEWNVLVDLIQSGQLTKV